MYNNTYMYLSISLQSMTMDMSSLMIDSEKNEPSIADLQVHGDCTGIYYVCCMYKMYTHKTCSEYTCRSHDPVTDPHEPNNV